MTPASAIRLEAGSRSIVSRPRLARRGSEARRHPGELVPRAGFIVINLSRPAERVVAFYNRRGTAEPSVKEAKYAIKWTWLSCRKFRSNEVRLRLHALAYNLGNLMRPLALPKAAVQRPEARSMGR